MLKMILAALRATEIEEYIAIEEKVHTAEMYFVRRDLDMPRSRDITGYRVKVYRDFVYEGERMKGESEVKLFPGLTALEVQAQLARAYEAALYVRNKYFELASPSDGTHETLAGGNGDTAEELALRAAGVLFGADNDPVSFINSAEIFGSVVDVRIVTSTGTDVKYTKRKVKGEYVVQCREPRDVEQYFDFDYAPGHIDGLGTAVSEALTTVRDRAMADTPPADGIYDVILSGKHLKTLLSYYTDRSNASMIYPGYSDWAPGTAVQGEDISGEKLSVTVFSDSPFSDEGIFMPERKLITEGVLELLHGYTRQCRYIGAEPTGTYRNIRLDCGDTGFDNMKQGCLYPVSFSDFQTDSLSGFFGGEIRLAYLFTENGVKILTGGSVNGNISEVQGSMTFSKERYSDSSYEGPMAVRLKNVRVAGGSGDASA